MTQRFSRKDSPQARETKLNALRQQTIINQTEPPFRFPVHSIFLTSSSQNPSSILGYGTWELIGSGKLILS